MSQPGVAAERRVPTPGTYELIDLGWQNTNPAGNLTKAHDKFFLTFDGVTPPTVHSILLLENTEIRPGETVLDMGTGCGIQAVFAAENASSVIATDIDPKAVQNARLNVERYEMEDKIDVRVGDLFGPIREGEEFDVVIMNLVYPFSSASEHLWDVHRRFFRQVRNYLKPGGRIYYQAGFIDNIPEIKAMITESGLQIVKMVMYADRAHDREPIIFTLEPR